MVHTLEIQSITRAVTEVTTPARNTETVAHSVSETFTVMQEKPLTVSREVKDVLHPIRAA